MNIRSSNVFAGPHGERLAPTPVAQTATGRVQGLSVDGVHRFLGMRYAQPPVGPRRFRPPVREQKWDGVAEAVHYGAPAMQGVPREALFPRNDFELTQNLHSPFAGLTKIHNEDCLYLNVWTTDVHASKPVLVWFHGGGFAYGSGSEPLYEGSRLAERQDIVVVTLNHRLNLFGYINLVGAGPGLDDAINAGARDLVLALEWVQENIAAFGGDPGNVTIAGESGGGAKVTDMLATPPARGLFHKAISMSGARERAVDFDEAARNSRAILRRVGMNRVDVDELARIPAQALLDAGLDAFSNSGGENLRYQEVDDTGDLAVLFGTTVGDDILPAHPFVDGAPQTARDIPLLIGWTKDEWTLMLTERDPGFVDMTEQDASHAAHEMYGAHGEGILAELRRMYPHYGAGHLAAQLVGATISGDAMAIALAKASQPAPVFVYELAWETPVHDGIYRSTHSLDLPLMFDTVESARAFVGDGDAPQRMADTVSTAWAEFMRDTAPSAPDAAPWRPIEGDARPVMRLDLDCELVDDPRRIIHALIQRAHTDAASSGDIEQKGA